MSQSASSYKVVLGVHDRSSPGSSHRAVNVQRITKHPDYNSPNEHSNDIAVIRLANSVPFSTSISPICLPQDDAPAGKQCVVTGWGETQGTGDNQRLLQVMVPIVSTASCNDRQHYRGAIDDTMLCAGVSGRDSCQGDSGGPLVCQRSDGAWELQGVVSWGIDCGAPNKPGVYSRVNALKDWIRQNSD
jgi:secreted trypsin-like serine protease